MKRRILSLLTLILLQQIAVQGQPTIKGTLPPLKLIERNIVDSAYTTVFYNFTYFPDVELKNPIEKCMVVLLIGNKYSCFMDWNSFITDSINDQLAIKKKNPALLFPIMRVYEKKYFYPLIINKKTGECVMQMQNLLTYQYSQQLPRMEWQLVDGARKEVRGVKCDKAICHWGGRDWEAWYSPEYAAPYGPYLFNGLPGLIFALKDTKNNFFFKLEGLDDSPWGRPVYLCSNEDIITTTRENARKAIQHEYADPIAAIKAKYPKQKIPKEMLEMNLSREVNLIEKE